MSSPVMVPRRRRSFAGPIVLIALGVIFLLGNLHVVSWPSLGRLFAQYWPVLIILWGAIKLIEYYQAQREGTRASGIGVGGFFLLIFLIIFGFSATQASRVNWHALDDDMDWGDHFFLFGDTFHFSDEMEKAFPAGASLRVVSDRGAVTVNAWDEEKIKVVLHKSLAADNEEQSKKVDSQTRPTISFAGTVVTLNANTAGAGEHSVSTDLDIYIPRKAPVDIATRRGDVSVHNRTAEVKISNSRGDVSLSDLEGNTSVVIRKGSISAAHIKGDLSLDGRLNDAAISDVTGNVVMTGDYFGDITLSKLAKGVRFKSSRTDFEFARLDGDLSMESGDLTAKSLTGPLRLVTKAKDIHLDDVSGELKLENSNGSVELHASKLPLGNMHVDNRKGDVQVVLPAQAAFTLDARTHNGEIASDFSQIQVNNAHEQATASGAIGNRGPRLEIYTEYGSIEIRKAGVTQAENKGTDDEQ
jgi:DUF4097 and DUF4098 domain-containing protein YvlB